MKRISLLLILSLFGIFVCCISGKQALALGSNVDKVEYYRFKVKKVSLPPIIPMSIEGLNTYLVKPNSKDAYLVTMFVDLEDYKWLMDVLYVHKSFTDKQYYEALESIPKSVYLSEKIRIFIKIKKIAGDNVSFAGESKNFVSLPYFVMASNKFQQTIYPLLEGKLQINLDSTKTIVVDKDIQIQFNQKYLDNVEILVGWKQTTDDYQALQNYIKLESKQVDLLK